MKSDLSTSDAGAVGIGLLGDDNEVASNVITGSDVCSPFYGRDGAAVEVYGGQRNRIHHNRATDNHIFSELGQSRARDNVFAYNLVTASLRDGHFLTTRGASDSRYGPVLNTRVLNNTVHLTGGASLALLCMSGCSPEILTFRNNVIWSSRIGSASASFAESHNLYWGPAGAQGMNFTISSTSRTADPRFVDRAAGNLRLASTSPARDAAGRSALDLDYARDLDRRAVPQAGAVDMGAYERLSP